MSNLDRVLVHEARKFITAANVHAVNTWIFCYENSIPDSPPQKHYEQLLRDFVATNRLMLGEAKLATDLGIKLRKASRALNEEIKRSL